LQTEQLEELARKTKDSNPGLQLNPIALTKDNVDKDPTIWPRLDRGEYNLVFASPEILMDRLSHFYNETMKKRDIAFRKKLKLIAVDEAHVIWECVTFRKYYGRIGQLRASFPNVPILAISATLPPHVREYIRESCLMQEPRLMILPGRRTNIDIVIAPQPSKSIQPLRKLIPNSIHNTAEIPKTLIFVDSIKDACKISRKLRKRLNSVLPGTPEDEVIIDPSQTIRSYFSITDMPTKRMTLNNLHEGSTRIVVCTDAMSLGVNIPDIERVVQWGVSKTVGLSTIVQRIGRCVRGRTGKLQGVAIIYVPDSIRDPVSSNWKEAWESEPSEKIIDDDDWIDDESDLPSKENWAWFSLPIREDTQPLVTRFQNYMYRRGKISQSARRLGAIKRKAKDPGKEKGKGKGKGPRRKPIEQIDLGLLWLINTDGCRHRVILSYMGYPDVYGDSDQQSFCCDNCALRKQLEPTLVVAGIHLSESVVFKSDTETKAKRRKRLPLVRPQSETLAALVPAAVDHWRHKMLQTIISRHRLPATTPAKLILPDSVRDAIGKAYRHIGSSADLRRIIENAGMVISTSLLEERHVETLFNLIDKAIHQPPAAGTIFRGNPSD
jgi:superfamily II DNA/RNA helicase